MSNAIVIENVGAIESLVIPIPEAGGVVELRGPNGCGKTTAIDAAAKLAAGKGSLDARDGSIGGKVEGFGAVIRVGKRASREGELVVEAIEGADLGDLIDPGVADADRADAARIKAICRLAGITASAEVFAEVYELAPGLVAVVEGSPLQDAASALKKDAEAEARKAEKEADTIGGEVQGLLRAISGLKLPEGDTPPDEKALRSDVERTVRALALAEARVQAAQEARERADVARQVLDAASGPVAGAATVRAAYDALQAEVDVLRGKLDSAVGRLEETARELAVAESRERNLAGWKASIEAAEKVEAPDELELAMMDDIARSAKAALENAGVIRRALDQRRQANELTARLEAVGLRASALRKAAKAAETCVTAALAKAAPRGLQLVGGRLVVDYPGRGQVFLAQLSHGERAKLALDLAIDAAGEGKLLPLRQETWEAMDPAARAAVAEHARSRRTVILTARATGGELEAAVL